MRGEVIHGECIAVMREMPENSVDAVVTDPPYGIGMMGRSWDSFEPKRYQEYCEEWGREAMRVLKPGGYLVSFGGSRMYHRMVAGLEDAGFHIKDLIVWLHSQGFPKSRHSLKPSNEPVVLAQKETEGTQADNIARWGTGGLNVEECRIGAGRAVGGGGNNFDAWRRGESRTDRPNAHRDPSGGHCRGRWPPNTALDTGTARMVDMQSGNRKAGGAPNKRNSDKFKTVYGTFKGDRVESGIGPSEGGASRFYYVSKANRFERDAGLDGEVKNDIPTLKPIDLLRHLVKLVTPRGGTVLDPFGGSGTTGVACAIEGFGYVLIESDARFAKEVAPRRIEFWSVEENQKMLRSHGGRRGTGNRVLDEFR